MSNTITPEQVLAQMRMLAAQAKGLSPQAGAAEGSGSSFAELLKTSIDKVNETQQQAARLKAAFQKGDPNVQLSEVMVAMEKSSVSFQALLQVRNKLVSAYQEIMNMQI